MRYCVHKQSPDHAVRSERKQTLKAETKPVSLASPPITVPPITVPPSLVPPRIGPALTGHRRSLNALTGIRFFAAFYVVMFHTRVGSTLSGHGHQIVGAFFQNGYLAVPLFFLLSGFILAYTYRGQIETRADHRRFWEARFARIWPVYMVSLLLASLPLLTFPAFTKALATIFMLQSWDPFDLGLAGTWNMVCWTLSVEALFYLLFPFVQVQLEKLSSRSLLLTAALLILVSILTNSSSRTLGYLPHGAYRYIPLAVCHLPEFFTGVACGNYFLDWKDRRLPGRGLFTYAAALLTIGLLCVPPGRFTSVVVLGFSLLIFALAAQRTLLSRMLSTPLALFGGGISYSVYLMQMPVKAWVTLGVQHTHVTSEVLRMGITTVILLLVASLLFRGVEDPARRKIRSLFAAIEQKHSVRSVRASNRADTGELLNR